MERIVIRRAVPPDAAGIAAVHVATWQHAYRDLLPDQFLAGLSLTKRAGWWRESLVAMTADSAVWVVELAGQIVGFCSLGPSRDQDSTPKTGELYAMYVHPRVMGQGIGATLMKTAHETLRELGYRRATLWVLVGNARASTFYERGGWRADGATKTEAFEGLSLQEMRYAIAYSSAP